MVPERAYRVISLEKSAERTGIPTALLSAIEEGTTDFLKDYMFLLLMRLISM